MSWLAWFAVSGVLATWWLAGRVCLGLLWPGGGALPWWRSLSRALLLGPAAVTVQMGLWHAVGVPFSLGSVLGPWWLAAWVWRRRAWPSATTAASASSAHSPAQSPAQSLAMARTWGGVLAVALAVTGVALGMAVATPVYTADGLNNFALPARVFATHADLAPGRLATLTLPGHLEYPPLVALGASLLMRAAALVDPADPGLLAIKPFFVVAVLAFLLLAVELCSRLLAPRMAVPAALLVCGLPVLLATPTAGMADLHLTAALMLLAVELVEAGGSAWRAGSSGRRSVRSWVPLGAAAGVCALTKDEGMAVASLAASLLPLAAWGTRAAPDGESRGARAGVWAGALLLLGLAWAWRGWLAWHGIDHEATLAWPAGGLGAALGRVPEIVGNFATLTWSYAPEGVSPWGLLWPVTAVAVAAALVWGPRASGPMASGPRAEGWSRRTLRAPAALLAAHLTIYVAVYAFNTQPLDWVLGNSAPRLFLHLLPWLLWLLCAALAPFGTPAAGADASGEAAGARNRT